MSTLWSAAHSEGATRWAKPVFDLPPAAVPLDAALEAAQAQARRVADEAEAQARGFASGHAAGFAQGLAEGRNAAETLAETLRAMLAGLAQPAAVVDAELERVLVALTLEAARRIAQQELALDPAKVACVVRDAVASLGHGARAVAVFVHPDDYAALAEVLGQEMRSSEGWRLVADPEVLPGGCRVESEQASVVASLDARAAGLAHALLGQT